MSGGHLPVLFFAAAMAIKRSMSLLSKGKLAPTRVTMSITHLISLEVVHMIDPVLRTRALPTLRNGAVISMLNVKVVIYVAAEVCRAMEPRTSTNKNPAGKPLRTIVPVGRTTIGSVVIVTIRTYRRDANIDADLGICLGRTRQQTQTNNSR
jgi:hypothetical protein